MALLNVSVQPSAWRLAAVLLLVAASSGGCESWTRPPDTPGDPQNAPVYGYTPVDAIPIELNPPSATRAQLLGALPDETMRLAVGKVDYKGGISYGPASIGTQGNSYTVIIDYMKFTTLHFGARKVKGQDNKLIGVELIEKTAPDKPAEVQVPVYVGVGLRVVTHLTVNQGSVDLGNLFAIGAAAQAKQITGSLVLQSLGLSGEGVNFAFVSDISASTIENAIQSIGSAKAKLYSGNGISVVPRVLGVYNNLGGGQDTINAFISSLLEKPLALKVPVAP